MNDSSVARIGVDGGRERASADAPASSEASRRQSVLEAFAMPADDSHDEAVDAFIDAVFEEILAQHRESERREIEW
ncbi:hypothetical protein [Salinarimonas sp.]|uniref:hypothetical protein n=1 Tax=Salinarimonas sp. TaxID=2766526 RepID=UPI0032D9977A